MGRHGLSACAEQRETPRATQGLGALDAFVESGALSASQAEAIRIYKQPSKRRLFVVPGVEGVTLSIDHVRNLRPAR